MKIRPKKEFPTEKLQVLAALFFKMIDEANDETIDKAVPWLGRVLQEFDHVFGFGEPAASTFAAAVDVRAFYVMFKGFQTKSEAERERILSEFGSGIGGRDQFEAICEVSLQLKRHEALRIRLIALFPVHRLLPEYQSIETLSRSGILSSAMAADARTI